MASLARKSLEETSSDLEMTPMIDVTFLLLIFFICATRFKSFENKLDTYLPKDTGPSSAPPPDERLPTEIKLREAGPQGHDVEIFVGYQPVADYAELGRRIQARHDDAAKKKELPVVVFATDRVRWEYVVKAFDVAINEGVEKVQFGIGKDNDIKMGTK